MTRPKLSRRRNLQNPKNVCKKSMQSTGKKRAGHVAPSPCKPVYRMGALPAPPSKTRYTQKGGRGAISSPLQGRLLSSTSRHPTNMGGFQANAKCRGSGPQLFSFFPLADKGAPKFSSFPPSTGDTSDF